MVCLLTGFELFTHTKLTEPVREADSFEKAHKAKRHKIEFEY